jgi:hypothetical protein
MTAQDEHTHARHVLENAETYELLPKHANMHVAARLWHYPTFTPSRSWTVLVTLSALLVRRIVWNPSRTAPALHGFFGSEGRLPLDPWRALMHRLETQTVQPFRQDSGMGRDGDTFGIELPGPLSSARLTWWQEPPAGWEGVAQCHTEAVALFQSVLPQSSA